MTSVQDVRERALTLCPGGTPFRASASWAQRFLGRKHLSLLRATNSSRVPVEDAAAAMIKFHNAIRRVVRKSGEGPYGAYPPSKRYNLDEVGSGLLSDYVRTIAETGSDHVWAPGGQGGKSRRFATIVVLIRAAGEQPKKLIVIFSGKGTLHDVEQPTYHPDVAVFWQPNAWMDSETWDAIVRSMEIEPDSLLYLDNLAAHRAADDVMKQRRILPFWGPKGLTDVWQPVDLNVGKQIKERIHKFMRAVQERDDTGYVDAVDAKTKRRLFTQVISLAHHSARRQQVKRGEPFGSRQKRFGELSKRQVT